MSEEAKWAAAGGAPSEAWVAVDRFVEATVAPEDDALRAALAAAEDAGMPPIQVTAAQGKLLHLLARAIGAGSILEFGTLAGYSTIWLARALSGGGRVLTIESDPAHAEVARANLERAGVIELVDLRVGAALDLLPGLEQEEAGPFDLVFIDADKVNTPEYCAWALEHTRPGGLIVADNVVRGGKLADESGSDEAAAAQRRLHEMLAAGPRAEATTIQTVGGKAYDGFTLVLVG